MKRRTRIFAIATALIMPSLGMAAWYGVTKYSDQDDRLGRILRDYGYRELIPRPVSSGQARSLPWRLCRLGR